MSFSTADFEALLPAYLAGELSVDEKNRVDEWRSSSAENELHFQQSMKAWESLSLLQEMEQFNAFEALAKVNARIGKSGSLRIISFVKWAAAILLLPLLGYSGFLTYQYNSLRDSLQEHIVMQKIYSRQGMVTQFQLADGTRVWLNSGSDLQFPCKFVGESREVILNGEAYFEVAKNKSLPFRVNARELKVEVLGTSFDVVSYKEENISEVILVEGKVQMSAKGHGAAGTRGMLSPGQRGIFSETTGKISTEEVSVEKYISWREGNLIFRDDKMEEVVKRLSRWFNVEININDPEIKDYIYKATFRNENLLQVLNLLKISAPIDFRITERKALPNGEFTKQKVYLMKKRG